MKKLNSPLNIYKLLENWFCQSNTATKIFFVTFIPVFCLIFYLFYLSPNNDINQKNLNNQLLASNQKLNRISAEEQKDIFKIKQEIGKFAKENQIQLQKSIFENNILHCEFEGEFENIINFAFFAQKILKKFDSLQLLPSNDDKVKLIVKVILENNA